MNYYNEFDPKSAAWLRELIRAGDIPNGKVDERSIADVEPSDLAGFTQCHFFAGIGGWSLALQYAGWPVERPVWTGSCPCQPFSAAGKGQGIKDPRHLWPELDRLITECGPAIVFGEQVASKDGLGWLDLVSADLERAGYATGAADLCAAGIGAPHIRQRLFWGAARLADSISERGCSWQSWGQDASNAGQSSEAYRLADTNGYGCKPGHQIQSHGQQYDSQHGFRQIGVADAHKQQQYGPRHSRQAWRGESANGSAFSRPNAPDNPWRDADWLYCRDDKWRSVEPGTQPLAHGVSCPVDE